MLIKIDKIIKRIVSLLIGGAVFYLFLLSVLGTSSAGGRNFAQEVGTEEIEGYNYCLTDNIGIHILTVSICIVSLYLIVYYLKPIKVRITWVTIGIGILYLAIGALLILLTRYYPISDSAKILRIAEQLVNGDFSEFRRNEGYLWRYPDQLGIIFFYYIVSLFFGKYNYLVLQFINLMAATAIGFISQKICNILWGKNWIRAVGVQLLYFAFIPLLFYVTYIYGTILGVCLSLLAIYYEIKYVKYRKIANILCAGVFISLAIMLKTNSMIMLVAMLIFLVYDMIMEKEKIRTALALIILISVQILFVQGLHLFMSNKTGMEISTGMPKLAWVAMGLQESRLAPGTWNGHSVSLYEEAGYDYDKANKLAIESIEDSVEEMWRDRSQTLLWFGKKMAFQWNDPFWGMNEMIRNRESDIIIPHFILSIINGKINYYLWLYLNCLQTIILTGSIFYLLLYRSKVPRESLILYVAFLGGFIFHIFWEAKREYTLPYFLIIFPYCVQGYLLLIEKVHMIIIKEYKIARNKLLRAVCVLIICVILFGLLYPTRLIQYTVAVHDEPELCATYQETLRISTLVNGD